MLRDWLHRSNFAYAKIEDSETLSSTGSHFRTAQQRRLSQLFLVLSHVCTLVIGIAAGYSAVGLSGNGEYGLLEPYGSVLKTFQYNQTFSLSPNPTTAEAWNSLFPRGFGFIQHPALAPNQSGVAVFHQLHCLNDLRKQFYAALGRNNVTGEPVEQEDKGEESHGLNVAHARHCFDLLRQSLMCAADTNIEPVDFELDGITGWGVKRKCRNFQKVFDWADSWAYIDATREMATDRSGNGR